MTKTRTKALALLLGIGFTMSAVCAALPASAVNVDALDTSTQMTYPFEQGEDAFRYAPTFTMAAEAGAGNNKWEYVEVKFDGGAKDLRAAEYLAVQIRVDQGDPGLTLGLIENGDRYNNSVDGNAFYFLSEDGTIREMSCLYSAINLGAGACGTLLMPMDSMAWQWNNNSSDLSAVTAFYYTTSTQFNYGYVLTIGSIGYYDGEPGAADTQFVTLADCSEGERSKDLYYVDAVDPDCMKMPSDAGIVEPEAPSIAYPFRQGEGADAWAAVWQGPVNGDSAANWQTLTVKFDEAAVDFSEASYLIIQYQGQVGAPGITFGLENKGARYSVGAPEADGKPVYFMGETDETSRKAANIANGAVTAGSVTGTMGAMIIPMDSMAWQFGEEENCDLSAIDTLVLTTNSQYNYNFRILIGEVGLYTGEAGSGTFTKILDLSSDRSEKFAVTSDLEANRGTLSFVEADAVRETMGDATIDITGEGKTNSSFSESGSTGNVVINGSYGSLEVVKDSYGEDALKLTATGITGDGFTAFTLSEGEDIDWTNGKGVSFWARNDSDAEVSFNLEVDCRIASGASSRFNILQGNRYWLYDVNTGKTTIYMSRPTATLPAGFEGWVRIPFSAFERASWSSGVSKEEFMSEGSVVSYFGITISAASYLNQSFSINNIGAYSTTPQFSSSFVDAGGKTIPELLGLN